MTHVTIAVACSDEPYMFFYSAFLHPSEFQLIAKLHLKNKTNYVGLTSCWKIFAWIIGDVEDENLFMDVKKTMFAPLRKRFHQIPMAEPPCTNLIMYYN